MDIPGTKGKCPLMGGVRLPEGEKGKNARGHIMHQNKYSRPLVIVLSIAGLLNVAFLLHIHKLNTYLNMYLLRTFGGILLVTEIFQL